MADKKQYLIRKSNELINAPHDLSLNELRLFLAMISKIKPTDTDLKTYRISFKELEELTKSTRNFTYSSIKNILIKLRSRVVVIKLGEDKERITGYIGFVDIDKGKGYVDVNFDERLKPFLVELQAKYTKYDVQYVLPMQSSYSIRIYELLKQYQKLSVREYYLEELRHVLQIDPGIYEKYNDFKKRVILQAQSEINAMTDIKFSFEEIKEGKKVIGLRFNIYPNNYDISKEEIVSHDYLELVDRLTNYGIAENMVKKIVDECDNDYDRLHSNINYALSQNKPQDQVAGFIIYCIKNDLQPPVSKQQMHLEIIKDQEIEQKDLQEQFEKQKNKKIDRLVKSKSDEFTKMDFIQYMQEQFPANYKVLLKKSPDEFSLEDMKENKFFKIFLGSRYLKKEENEFEYFVNSKKKK